LIYPFKKDELNAEKGNRQMDFAIELHKALQALQGLSFVRFFLCIHQQLQEFSKCIWRAPYTHEYPSYKRGVILCLHIMIGRDLTSILKIPSSHRPYDLGMFRCMIIFMACFNIGESYQ
jgi:hypothetical protein